MEEILISKVKESC